MFGLTNQNQLKEDFKSSNTVRIGSQRERASMFHQHFANKDEADTLPIRFGRKEWREQFGFYLLADTSSRIAYFQH